MLPIRRNRNLHGNRSASITADGTDELPGSTGSIQTPKATNRISIVAAEPSRQRQRQQHRQAEPNGAACPGAAGNPSGGPHHQHQPPNSNLNRQQPGYVVQSPKAIELSPLEQGYPPIQASPTPSLPSRAQNLLFLRFYGTETTFAGLEDGTERWPEMQEKLRA